MKRALSNSAVSLNQTEGNDNKQTETTTYQPETSTSKTESIGIHFSYKNTQRLRNNARKGRNLGGFQTRHRAEVVGTENENTFENQEKMNEEKQLLSKNEAETQRGSKPVRVPKQTRQMKLNFSTNSKKHFPALEGSKVATPNENEPKPGPGSKSPGNAWERKAHLQNSKNSSPVTSSPLAKMAKPSESPIPFKKPLAPAESPLTMNSSANVGTYTRSGSKAQAKLFTKSPGSVFNTTGNESKGSNLNSSPSDIDLNQHQFSSTSWADIMDEVDSIKSGNLSLMSMETGSSSLNTTFDSVESGDVDGMMQRRSKQIAYGKNTKEYQFYINTVPYEKRKRSDPVTPNKDETYSRRHWDNKIKIWKRQIKEWSSNRMNGSPAGSENSSGSARNSLAKILESLPVASKMDPKSPMKKTLAELGNLTPSKSRLLETSKVTSGKSPAKSPFKRPLAVVNIDNAMIEGSPSKKRNLNPAARTICTRSLVAAMNEDSLLNDDDCPTGSSRRVLSSRVDESSCSTLVDENSCMSTDAGWTVTRMPMPKEANSSASSQLQMFIQSCQANKSVATELMGNNDDDMN